ncbi:MAG: thioredoxin family protein [Campylobacterales bacterium]|nr:thioredoxin family protein [Campylobacterales bacterium]
MNNLTIVCANCSEINSIELQGERVLYECKSCKEAVDDSFPVEVSDTSAKLHIDNDELPLILSFYSEFCGPCVAMEEDYENAAMSQYLQTRFLRLDADKHHELAKSYGVQGVPTLIAFKDGTEIARATQALSEVQLTIWAERLRS